MAIKFRCPDGHVIQVDEGDAGEIARCPTCETKVRIPAARATADSGDASTVRCPNGHPLKISSKLVGKTVQCPACNTQFRADVDASGLGEHANQSEQVAKLTVRCPNGHKIRVSQDHAGKLARCPSCQVKFRIASPSKSASLSSADATSQEPPVSSAPSSTAIPADPDESNAEAIDVDYAEPGDAVGDLPDFFSDGGIFDPNGSVDPLAADPLAANPLAADPLALPTQPAMLKPAAPISPAAAESNVAMSTLRRNPKLIIAVAATALIGLFTVGGLTIYLLGSSDDAVAEAETSEGSRQAAEAAPEQTTAAAPALADASPPASAETPPFSPSSRARQAPKSRGPWTNLIERAEYFALNPNTGALAAVQPISQNLYLYSAEYVTTGQGTVVGPVDAGRLPGPIAFKQYGDQALFVVADTNDPYLRCYDAETLELVRTIKSPCVHNTGVAVSEDTKDGRIYFCTNPYPKNSNGGATYLCAADLGSDSDPKIVFHERSTEPEDCYVSPVDGFLYGRKFQYPFVVPLDQCAIEQLTVSGTKISVSNSTTYEHLAIDPSGASVGFSDSLMSPDMQSEFLSYEFAIQCYLRNRPCVAGYSFERERPPHRGAYLGMSITIAGLDSAETLQAIPTGLKTFPSGLSFAENRTRFVKQAQCFHSLATDSIVMAFRDTVMSFSLAGYDLPTGPSPLPLIEYPTRIRVGTTLTAKMSVPADPAATFSISEAPEGAILKGNLLTWTPGEQQTGWKKIPVSWSSNGRNGEIAMHLQVDNASGSLAADRYTPSGVARADSKKNITNRALDPELAQVEPGEFAHGKVYKASFPIQEVHSNSDNSVVLGLGWDDPKGAKERTDDVTTHCAVIDLTSGKVEAETDVQMNVFDAAIDSHHVYLKGVSIQYGAKVMVLNRADLSLKTALFCSNNSDFGAFADRIFVSTHVYAVPSLKIIRTDPRARTSPFRRVHPPILEGQLDQFYSRNQDGWIINGLQYTADQSAVQMVFAVDALGELHFCPAASQRRRGYGLLHPTRPLEFSRGRSGSTVTLEVFPWGSSPKDVLKTYRIGIGGARYTGQPVIAENVAMVTAGGAVYRVDIGDTRDLEVQGPPRFIQRQSSFLIDQTGPTTLEYTIEGGVPPYTVRPGSSNLVEQQVAVDGNTLKLTVSYSDWYAEGSKKWMGNLSKSRELARSFQKALTGYPPEPAENEEPVLDLLIQDLRDFCANKLRVRVPRGRVPVPVQCDLQATDAEGEKFDLHHWLFLSVKESDFRQEVEGRR